MASGLIKGLIPNDTYSVKVRAKSSNGEVSDWSRSVTFNVPSKLTDILTNTYNTLLSGTISSGTNNTNLTLNGTTSPYSLFTELNGVATTLTGGVSDTSNGFILDTDGSTTRMKLRGTNGYLTFDGSNLAISGNLNASSGSIGGFTIASSSLYAGSGSNFVGIIPASLPFFAGATDNAGTGAKFSVSNAGAITSTSGAIGGFSIGQTSLTSGSGSSQTFLQSTFSPSTTVVASGSGGSLTISAGSGVNFLTSGFFAGMFVSGFGISGATYIKSLTSTVITLNQPLVDVCSATGYKNSFSTGGSTAQTGLFSVDYAGNIKSTTGTFGRFKVNEYGFSGDSSETGWSLFGKTSIYLNTEYDDVNSKYPGLIIENYIASATPTTLSSKLSLDKEGLSVWGRYSLTPTTLSLDSTQSGVTVSLGTTDTAPGYPYGGTFTVLDGLSNTLIESASPYSGSSGVPTLPSYVNLLGSILTVQGTYYNSSSVLQPALITASANFSFSSGRVGYNFSGTSATTTTRAYIAPTEGFVWATRAGTPLVLQRTGTNGTIATFYNDTTQSGYLAVGTSSLQLYGSVTLQLSSGSSNVNLDPQSHLTGNSVIYGDVSNTGPRGLIISNSTGGYVIGTASSTRRVKQQISDFEWDAESILKVVPKKFKYNSDVENFGDNANWAYGLLAEDLDDLGLEGLINRDEQGIPDYVSYEKVGVALISVVKYQQKIIEDLESRIALLEK